MKRVVMIALVACTLAVPVRAQSSVDPEALKAAQELAAIVNADTMTKLSRSLSAQMWPAIASEFADKVDQATVADLKSEFERASADFALEMMKSVPAVYAKHFSAAELREMLAFYKTPTGMKALRVMPVVMTDIMASMTPRVQALQTEMQQRIEAVLKKHGYPR